MSEQARWFWGCEECRHEEPGHHPGCTMTPVSDDGHRRKLVAELDGPFVEIARTRLAQLDGFENPPRVSMPGKDRYLHEDCTTYVGPLTAYYIDRPGVWYLTEDHRLINLDRTATPTESEA